MREAMRARAVLAVLLLISVTLILLDVRGSAAVGGVRGVAAAVVGPVERAMGAVAAPFVAVGRSVTSFGDEADRNRVAADQLNGLANGADNAAEIGRQSQHLDAMLGFAGLAGYRVLPARVVAYGTSQSFSGMVTIDAGSSDGLSTEMSVINGEGLVGRVVSVGLSTATVQLVTDDDSVVGARAEGTGEAGALQGSGEAGEAVLRLLDPTAPFKPGDRLVTFGSPDGRPYAPGIPLGTITSLRGEAGQADRAALVKPAVRMGALDVVGVVIAPSRVDPRDSLLPPPPHASAGASPTGSGR